MSNPITNRLRLVEAFPVEGIPLFGNLKIRWFDRVVFPIEGMCQEIYRGKTYIDSVHPSSSSQTGKSIKARKGDLIYRVSLTPQPDDLTGIVKTKDGYRRMYNVHIQLRVNNPHKCVECYRNGEDPASLAIVQFKTSFENFFSRYTHDSIGNVNPGFDALNKQMSNVYGIIFESPSWSFYADQQREKELEIQQGIEMRKREILAEVEIKLFELRVGTKLKKEEINHDVDVKKLEDENRRGRERNQKQFERDEKVKQTDFNHAEKIKTQLNEAKIKLLSMTLSDLAAVNSERIRDAFDTNASVRTVLEDSLKLLAVFTPSNNNVEEAIDSNLLNEEVMNNLEEDRET